jgi:putative ABC transport system permease protein
MNLAQTLAQAVRMSRRDWRAGELRLLCAALVVAVAAVTSVGFFVDRIRLGLERDATQLLGADVVLSADQPIGPEPAERARSEGLMLARTVSFPSMALAAEGEGTSLAAVKAVSPEYPLRGSLRVLPAARTRPRARCPRPARCGSTRNCCRRWAWRWATICAWASAA